MRRLFKFAIFLFATVLFLGVVGFTSIVVGLWHYGRDLPDYKKLADYEPPTVTRVHAGDGLLIAEYAKERRVFVPIEAMPRRLIEAFIAAEDQNFYQHPGVDFIALARAMLTNIKNLGSNRRPVGASTITQQVAKNFLLTNEVSIERKIKEAILAFRIERAFSKDRILELYLNEIYLGSGSYGCAAAALNYFDKSLGELTIAEAAFLAALPKAPNNYHPIRKRQAAVGRRNWVIGRMYDEGFIDLDTARMRGVNSWRFEIVAIFKIEEADFFVEQVRRDLNKLYGDRGVYEQGLSVRTTLDTRLQKLAETALRDGLMNYDRRYGWRGPIAKISIKNNWFARLNRVRQPVGIRGWRLAVVLYPHELSAELGFTDGSRGTLPFAEMSWARNFVEWGKRGEKISTVGEGAEGGRCRSCRGSSRKSECRREAADEVSGRYVFVAADPRDQWRGGRDGSAYGASSLDGGRIRLCDQPIQSCGASAAAAGLRVQAVCVFSGARQWLHAVDDDSRCSFRDRPGAGPRQVEARQLYAKILRAEPHATGGREVAQLDDGSVGARRRNADDCADYAQRFGIIENMPQQLSMALGSGETTLLQLTSAYAMLVNGGKRIQPSLIDRVQNRHGKTVLKHDKRPCFKCSTPAWNQARAPKIPDERAQIVDAGSAYQVVSMLEGAVKRGTGRRISSLAWPLAGKTGTTNESKDTWFIGFSPDLVVGVFVGFDNPLPLGRRETGSSVAAPIFQVLHGGSVEG